MENEQSTEIEAEPIGMLIGVIEYTNENGSTNFNVDDIKTFKSIQGATQSILDRINNLVSEYGKENIELNLGDTSVGTAGEFKIKLPGDKTISFVYSEIPLYE
jgi:hypothetical protein